MNSEEKKMDAESQQVVAGDTNNAIPGHEAVSVGANVSSMQEISLIENLSSFLQANGTKEIDASVLQNMAAALANRTSDTSPGTLQDVTMENSYFIYRAPCALNSQPQCQGTTSPVSQGRSVREFEEQMSALRKENFNLKLRLYFMEESVPGYKQPNEPDTQETLKKQLIDAKVENEMLRKDLTEKQEVLKDAAIAINHFEKCQQEAEARSQEVIEELQERIRYLEMGQESELQSTNISDHVSALQKIRELEDLLQQSESKLSGLQEQLTQHEATLAKRDQAIKEYEEKLQEVVFRNAALVQTIDCKEEIVESAERTAQMLRAENSQLHARNSSLNISLQEMQAKRRTEVKDLELCERQMRMQQESLLKIQALITTKTANSVRLLATMQAFEQMVTRANLERNLAKRENSFFRRIIDHMQSAQAECDQVQLRAQTNGGDEYDKESKLRQKLSLNLNKMAKFMSTAEAETMFSKEECGDCNFMALMRDCGAVSNPSPNSPDNEPHEYERLKEELQAVKIELADKACMLQEAEESLEERSKVHEQACRTIEKLMVTIKSKQNEVQKLKAINTHGNNDKSGGESGTECTGLCRSLSDSEALKELGGGNLKDENDAQKQTIKSLKVEIKKLTANLQNLVNNELWEKNREIERLTKLINKTTTEAPLLSPSSSKSVASELQKSFTETDYVRAVERNRLLQRKVDVLIQRLGSERQNDALVTQLRHEVQVARTDAEIAEKWRRECVDVCSALSTRLEELAGFLKSLLMHKDVLGFLAADRRRAMRKAVDRSLDLSKSLNMTLSVSAISMGDQSLAQWSNVSEILADVDTTENHTFNSHEEQQAVDALETLKAENSALKKELDRRRNADVRKERRSLPLHTLENQSESEAWSEPDRKVSLARIGLEEHADLTAAKKAHQNTDSESDELNHSRATKLRTQERIGQLEQSIARRDERIVEIQSQLKKETLRVVDMTQEIEQLRQRNEELQSALDKAGVNDESMLLRQLDEKMDLLEQVQEERDRINAEAQLAGMQISDLQVEIDDLKHKHDVELALAVEEERSKLEQLQSAMEQRLKALQSAHDEELKRSWVARTCYEECKQQLTELQRQKAEFQHTIDCLTESEKELKQSLVENEHATRALKKQLDESMLQASKAVLERTKACNEKLQMETRMQQLTDELQVHAAERSAAQRHIEQLESNQECLQKQLTEATVARLNGSDASQSGYTSEEVPHAANKGSLANRSVQRPNNSSPDLGIESDAGRVSSVELSHAQRTLLKCVELSPKSSKEASTLQASDAASNLQHQLISSSIAAPAHDCAKVEQENAELKLKLHKTTRALKNTYEQLRIGNQKKAQVEKEIKNQILKTHDVLKNVRSNMENEL